MTKTWCIQNASDQCKELQTPKHGSFAEGMNWLKMSVWAVRLHIAALGVHHTWEGLPAIGVMLWLSIPMGVGGGTTPMSAPTGVPALGEFCVALSRSCCSATLAARSESTTKDKNNLMFHGEPGDIVSLYQISFVKNSKLWLFTFILSFLSGLKVPPLCAHQSAEFSKGEVRVLGLDDSSHFTAEENVPTHVDLPLCSLLLRQTLDRLWCGLWKNEMLII